MKTVCPTGLVPRRIRFLSECYNIAVPRSNLLSTDKQETIRNLLKEYYAALCKHLIKVSEMILLLSLLILIHVFKNSIVNYCNSTEFVNFCFWLVIQELIL